MSNGTKYWDIIIPFVYIFSKTRPVKCPDGIKYVYKDVNDAFPFYLKGFEANLSASINPTFPDNLQFAAQYKTKVDELSTLLDMKNKDLTLSFRCIYAVFQADPCNKIDYLASEVKQLITAHQKFKQQSLEIKAFIKLANTNASDPNQLATKFSHLEKLIRDPELLKISEAFKLSNTAAEQLN